MIHNTKDGGPKILPQCNLPLTGPKCVSLIVTELAVFEVDKKEGLTLIEKIPEISVEELVKRTAAPFKVSPTLCDMQQ
jgi:3-oxoacid CoA-transferase